MLPASGFHAKLDHLWLPMLLPESLRWQQALTASSRKFSGKQRQRLTSYGTHLQQLVALTAWIEGLEPQVSRCRPRLEACAGAHGTDSPAAGPRLHAQRDASIQHRIH